jgi:anti-sigma28 factor (negative regulator of flagellin synthesis)
MRVENGAVGSSGNDVYTSRIGQNVTSSPAANTSASAADQSSLSNASELVAMAKNMMPADRVTHFRAISAAVSTGNYEADPAEISHAVIEGHLND